MCMLSAHMTIKIFVSYISEQNLTEINAWETIFEGKRFACKLLTIVIIFHFSKKAKFRFRWNFEKKKKFPSVNSILNWEIIATLLSFWKWVEFGGMQ